MKIATVQMNIQYGNPETNLQAVEEYIRSCAAEKVDVIVFPEMWNTGYSLTELKDLADEEGNKTKALLSQLAAEHHVNIIGGSVATKKENEFYNTMYVFNRNGEMVSEYDKAHLFKLMDEHKYIQSGNIANLFEVDDIMCGGVICYDLRFPEWIRTHVVKGAKIMFIPAQWPKARIDHWQILLQARAIENQCFIVAVNRVGADPNNEFNGHSMVIAPWGEVLLGGKEEEGIYVTEIDLSEVERVRKTIPIFEDRRVNLYKL